MVFSSLIFLFRFLPLILLIYYIVPGKFKNMVLLSGSLVFYAWSEPKYVLIMIFSTLVNYIFGILIEDFKKKIFSTYVPNNEEEGISFLQNIALALDKISETGVLPLWQT